MVMPQVRRDEIVDYQTYEDDRETFRRRVLAVKAPRRVHVGPYVTFLFENALTIRYQIQEMIRVERIVRESDIQREVDTYNEILGGEGQLGCTMLIEVEDPAERATKLVEWLGLPARVYVRLEDGTRVRPTVDERQQDGTRVSSVQYLKFAVGSNVPTAIGIDFPGLAAETRLTDEQRRALADDLTARA
jgi:hypothetical protein